MYRLQQDANDIEASLFQQLSADERKTLEERLREIKLELEPPIFDRPRNVNRRLRDNTLEER